MQMKITRYTIQIIPEDEKDEAFLEEVLGLKGPKSSVRAARKNAIGLSCWAYLEIGKDE